MKPSYKPDSVFVWSSLWDAGCPAPLAALPRAQRVTDFALWPCSRWGLPGVYVSVDPVRSYRTISPLPRINPRRYVSVALSVGLPRPAVSRHRYPMESGLSSVSPSLSRITTATTQMASTNYSIQVMCRTMTKLMHKARTGIRRGVAQRILPFPSCAELRPLPQAVLTGGRNFRRQE